jgi:hypothetical protein
MKIRTPHSPLASSRANVTMPPHAGRAPQQKHGPQSLVRRERDRGRLGIRFDLRQTRHGHDHASYHCNHRSFAWWRGLLWARTLVVKLFGPANWRATSEKASADFGLGGSMIPRSGEKSVSERVSLVAEVGTPETRH